MELEIHRVYIARTAASAGEDIRALQRKMDDRLAQIDDGLEALTTDIKLLQDRISRDRDDTQRHKALGWTLIIGVLLALVSAGINLFWKT